GSARAATTRSSVSSRSLSMALPPLSFGRRHRYHAFARKNRDGADHALSVVLFERAAVRDDLVSIEPRPVCLEAHHRRGPASLQQPAFRRRVVEVIGRGPHGLAVTLPDHGTIFRRLIHDGLCHACDAFLYA